LCSTNDRPFAGGRPPGWQFRIKIVTDPPVQRKTVLVIDGEVQIRRLLRVCLEKDGYRAVEAGTGEDGITEAARNAPDAVLLDLRLPDMDGLAVLKRLREWSAVPVLVVSAHGRDDDKITALDNGANDYVTKPFSTGELLARLRAALRQARPPTTVTVFESGPLTVDLATRTVKVGGRKVRLTATEYALLCLFVQHAGKVLTHGQIVRELWSADKAEKTGQLRVYMAYLREKLEANPGEPELLITEPGVGYRLVVPD
jgi:two-component system, OmpR family, KDP operon response regulator KdpE